jgi:RNA polymerase sigma-70 factor (ECF subfamily)
MLANVARNTDARTLGLIMEKTILPEIPVDKTNYIEVEEIALAKKDRRKFAPLYERYYENIFRYANRRINDVETCYDITSQVFLKAMLNLDKYEYRNLPFSSWLYRIANNEVVDFFRRNAKKAERSIDINKRDIEKISEETEINISEHLYEKLFKEIKQLPEDELLLLEMRFFEHRAFKEIGEILDITENNAKVKLYRVLDKLKLKFNPQNS